MEKLYDQLFVLVCDRLPINAYCYFRCQSALRAIAAATDIDPMTIQTHDDRRKLGELTALPMAVSRGTGKRHLCCRLIGPGDRADMFQLASALSASSSKPGLLHP